jgi:hypothetical protein
VRRLLLIPHTPEITITPINIMLMEEWFALKLYLDMVEKTEGLRRCISFLLIDLKNPEFLNNYV